jgi:hypothetical protein
MRIPFLNATPLPGLARALELRYPGVAIIWAYFDDQPSRGEHRIQEVRFSAPIETLKACGLLTDAMIAYAEHYDSRRRRPRPPCGDSFFLAKNGFDAQSRPGCSDLMIITTFEDDPTERISRRELRTKARRELARIFRGEDART